MIILLFYLQTVQFVHQVNSDAQVDSASQQAGDVMIFLVVQMEVMKLAAVSVTLTNYKSYMYYTIHECLLMINYC